MEEKAPYLDGRIDLLRLLAQSALWEGLVKDTRGKRVRIGQLHVHTVVRAHVEGLISFYI